jgi:hypothetical protein
MRLQGFVGSVVRPVASEVGTHFVLTSSDTSGILTSGRPKKLRVSGCLKCGKTSYFRVCLLS